MFSENEKASAKYLCGKLAPAPDVKTSPGDLVGLPALRLCVLGEGVSFVWGKSYLLCQIGEKKRLEKCKTFRSLRIQALGTKMVIFLFP